MSELCSPMVNDKIKGNSGPMPGQKSGGKKTSKSAPKFGKK